MAEPEETEESFESEELVEKKERESYQNQSEKRFKKREHLKTRHSAMPSHKPPTGQPHTAYRVQSTAGDGLLNPVSFSNTSKHVASKTDIPRSQHIGVTHSTDTSQSPHLSLRESPPHFAQNEDRSDSSLALSDQVRHHSSKLRDAVFAEWLAEKGSHMKKEQEALHLKKKRQEQAKVEQMVTREAKIVDSLRQWTEKKSVSIKSIKQKQRQEEEAKTEQEQKKLEKEQESEEAAKRWRKEQVKKLIKEHRSKKTEQEEKEKAKNEEMEEKTDSASQAFKAWSEKKDKDRSKMAKQKRSEVKQSAQAQAVDRETRTKEAASAYQAWKAVKDRKIKSTGSLYTYNTNPRQPPKNKWCPARSVKYSYSSNAVTNEADKRRSRPPSSQSARSRKSQSDTQSVKSYNSSFESDHGNSVLEDVSREEDRVETNAEKGQQTGTLKTVQVCCQTVEFLCTCEL